MGPGFRIGRLFGIDIAIHPSWIIIVALMTFSLAESWFPAEGWSTATTWTVALAAALLLFVSVLVHELAHSLVARAQGIQVRSITLFLLGGVSTIESESTSPGREALMAGAGPASSLAIGLGCVALSRAVQTPSIAHALLFYLGYINLLLAVFNMLPGFPLDGSRVLRSALWAITRDPLKATRWAARAGQVLGFLMIAVGVYDVVRPGAVSGASAFVGGAWFALIGWIVVQSSRAAHQQSRAESWLAGVPVRNLMSQPATWIPGDITLRKAANDYFLALNARCLPVQDDHGTLEGLVCVSDLQRTDERSWGVDQVQDVMTAVDHLQTVSPDEPAGAAFHRLATSDVSQLAVIEDGRLVGFVDQASVGRYLQAGGRTDSLAHDRADP
jgi:Zn-dependent protease/CBS domain-containing protein